MVKVIFKGLELILAGLSLGLREKTLTEVLTKIPENSFYDNLGLTILCSTYIGLIVPLIGTSLAYFLGQGENIRIMELSLNGFAAIMYLTSEGLLLIYVGVDFFEILGKIITIALVVVLVLELILLKSKSTIYVDFATARDRVEDDEDEYSSEEDDDDYDDYDDTDFEDDEEDDYEDDDDVY